MDDSWSWDGSIISLTSSFPSPNSSSSPSPAVRSRVASTRSLQESGQLDAPEESLSPAEDSAALGTTPTAPPPPLIEPPLHPRPSPTSLASSPPSTSSPPQPDLSPPLEPHRDPSHPLASFLLAEHSLGFSPPASPAASTSSSFPGSRARLSSAGGVQRGRARGRGRTGSVSSTASTDGSAHEGESLASGGVSSGEEEHSHDGAGGAGGLVMPSMHLGGGGHPRDKQGQPGTRFGVEGPPASKANVLVLGKSDDERRTLATLLSHDDDLRRATSDKSVADLAYSFLSTRPSERSHPSGPSGQADKAPCAAALAHFELISPTSASTSSPSFAFVDLYQPSSDIEGDAPRLASELLRPLEQLEAKLDRSYPSTNGLFELVEKAGCGEFEAAFFLFSSPPTAAEIAYARPLSHLIPLYPILILPPSPTGKPQKTYAIEQAVQEQLDKAAVRWVSNLPLSAGGSQGRKGRDGQRKAELCLLPHDLFVHHSPAQHHSAVPSAFPTAPPSTTSSSSSGPSAPASTGSTQVSSPASEHAPPSRDAPTSLTSSQELPSAAPATPHSPAFTGVSSSFRSLSSSFTGASLPSVASSSASRSTSLTSSRSSSHHRRASSHRRSSRSHRSGEKERNSTSLHSLHALQAIIHSSSAAKELRKERARQFLEWREVEVAARGEGGRVAAVEDLPSEWEEKLVAFGKGEEGGEGGRREIDFSKRVAERRRALDLSTRGKKEKEERAPYDADDDVLASSSDEDEGDDEADASAGHAFTGGTARNSFSYSYTSTTSGSMDPTTPRVSYRPLGGGFSTFDASSSASGSGSGSGSGYFPPFPPPPSSDDAPALSASFTSSSGGSGLSGASVSGSSSGMTTALSILLLPAAASDPFHLPSLLHLVGLNLRLAVFSPSFSAAASPVVSSQEQTTEEGEKSAPRQREGRNRKGGSGWGTWIGAAAVVGLVFAAGVAVGAQAGEGGGLGGQERWWSLFGR